MIGRHSTRLAIEFGETLASRFAERYPPTLDKPNAPPVSIDRLSRILENIYAEAQVFDRRHRLGYFRRARLCHAFKWRLIELGYSKRLIDLATEGLVLYLHKPTVDEPGLNEAGGKRARRTECK